MAEKIAEEKAKTLLKSLENKKRPAEDSPAVSESGEGKKSKKSKKGKDSKKDKSKKKKTKASE